MSIEYATARLAPRAEIAAVQSYEHLTGKIVIMDFGGVRLTIYPDEDVDSQVALLGRMRSAKSVFDPYERD